MRLSKSVTVDVSTSVTETVTESVTENDSGGGGRRSGKLRRAGTVVATAFGSLALAVALPASSAGAATGPFSYVYNDASGAQHLGLLVDPPSLECITLPEVADRDVPPAHTPRNYTSSTATVFAGADCTGDYFSLRANGGHASERLKVRSVVFS
ncbi:hypothetical protein AB0G35_33970 [Streptomyces sp. NPDC021749]|uniref:hypothetical protein n=1 Tax=Streptomyces sp. NPDC021749 TaxID=3154905 RepID=UPI00340BB760